jgi:hypothetical protein
MYMLNNRVNSTKTDVRNVLWLLILYISNSYEGTASNLYGIAYDWMTVNNIYMNGSSSDLT